MKLPSKVRFADEKTKEAFEKLKDSIGKEEQLYKWLTRAFKDIEETAFCGIQVPKKLIPKEYIQRFNVRNLWKYNLPNAWRLIYSIENQEIIIVSIVLEWLTHKEYERKFRY